MPADVLLAGLLSAVRDPSPPALPPPPPAIAPEDPKPLPAPPPPSKTLPQPLTVSVPPEPAIARQRPSSPITWQLFCQGDGKLYRHTDKTYLERYVAERNALYANAQQALSAPRTFFNPMPGYGFGGGCSSGSCSTGR